MKMIYALILNQNEAVVLHRHEDKIQSEAWETVTIDGEQQTAISNAQDLTTLLHKLNQKLNLTNQLEKIALHVLYGEQQITLLNNLPQTLADLNCSEWQILQWQPLYVRTCTSIKPSTENPLHDVTWLCREAMNMLEFTLNYKDKVWEAERKRAKQTHEESIKSLKAERVDYEAVISRLRGEIQAMQRLNMEQLVSYLPAIYQNFWTNVSPSDLAHIANTFEVPDIPSSTIEPSPYVIEVKKKQLQALPADELARLINFCKTLGLSHLIRPSMKVFFEEY